MICPRIVLERGRVSSSLTESSPSHHWIGRRTTYLSGGQDLVLFYPIAVFDYFQGVDEVGRIRFVRADVLRGAHLVEREFSGLEFLPREREGSTIDVGEDDELVVLRELGEGVAGIGEHWPVFDGLAECHAFLLFGFD